MPISDPRSLESRGSCQLDARPLLVKAPGQEIREGTAAYFGHLFVPVESRGKGISTAITRDLRVLLQSHALAHPFHDVELLYGQAEPKLSAVCAR